MKTTRRNFLLGSVSALALAGLGLPTNQTGYWWTRVSGDWEKTEIAWRTYTVHWKDNMDTDK